MSATQTENHTNPAAEVPPQDPPAPVNSRQRTTYNVYLSPDSLEAIRGWLLGDEGDSPVEPRLQDVLPPLGGDDDLVSLGEYSGANKDAAVDAMLNDEQPSPRVEVVQAAYAAHLDLYFPAPPQSYLKPVPKEWQMVWTPKVGGR
jgi:hypothetical protein